MPDLGALAQEYEDQRVQIVGLVSDVLTTDGSLDQDQMELARESWTPPPPTTPIWCPPRTSTTCWARSHGCPMDENGAQVRGTYIGAKDKDQWQQIIDQLLTEVEA